MSIRWSDHHVRGRPDLLDLAKKYLEGYTGSFYFLQECRQRVDRDEQLSVPLVRGVLNCMAGDPTVHNMPVPETRAFDAGFRTATFGTDGMRVHFEDMPASMFEEEVFVPARKQIRLKTRWHKIYGISKATNARLIHAVDQKSSALTWWSDSIDRASSRFIWEMNWACTPHLYMRGRQEGYEFTKHFILLTEWEAAQLLLGDAQFLGLPVRSWKWCAKCREELLSR